MTLTYEFRGPIQPLRRPYALITAAETHHWQVLDSGLGPQRAVSNRDLTELDGRVWRLEQVLRDVGLHRHHSMRVSIDPRTGRRAGAGGKAATTHDVRPRVALAGQVQGTRRETREHFDTVRQEADL